MKSEELNKIEMEKNTTDTKNQVLSKIKFMEQEDLSRVLNGAYIAQRFLESPVVGLAKS